jgi:hypothetical protein
MPRTDEESSLQTAISDSQHQSQKVEQPQYEEVDQPAVDLANPQVLWRSIPSEVQTPLSVLTCNFFF